MTLPIPPIIAEAGALVQSVIGAAHVAADQTVSGGLTAIETLGSFTLNIPQIEVPVFELPNIALPVAGEVPEPPPAINFFAELPIGPSPATSPANVSTDAPNYTLSAPMLADIELPDPLQLVAPAVPTSWSVGVPVEPGFVLPEVPSYAAFNLPDAPVFDLPAFTVSDPQAPELVNPQLIWSEVDYRSDQLAMLNTRLGDLVNGDASALDGDVEEAMWQKGCDAEALLRYQAVNDALQQSAARGFSVPGGQLVRVVQSAIATSLEKDSAQSRVLMVDQLKLEQSNFQFAFTQAMQLEARLMELFNQFWSRALDAAQFRVAALVDLANARVTLYQEDVRAFAVKADVFKTRLQAALAQLDVYRTQLQGIALRGELNLQMVKQYAAQIEAVKVMGELFTARVQAVGLTVKQNTTKLELYRSEIDAYSALSRSHTVEVQGYLNQIEGQTNHVKLFSKEISGYGARVDAYKVLADAKLADATFDFEALQRFPVQLYKAKMQGFEAQISGQAAQLEADAERFSQQIQAYSAQTRSEDANAGARADVLDLTQRLATAQAKTQLQAGVNNLRMAVLQQEMAQSALRATGQVTTQLGSAALSARNVSAGITGNTSNSASQSVANHTSVSASNSSNTGSSNAIRYSSSRNVSNSGYANVSNNQSQSNNESRSSSVESSVSNNNSQSSSTDYSNSVRRSRSSSFSNGVGQRSATIYRHKG